MRTQDLDGTAYENERRDFYIPEKRASVNQQSYAYRWRSGFLTGSCAPASNEEVRRRLGSVRLDTDKIEPIAVDIIELDPAALFKLDSTEFSERGANQFNQTLERLRSYQQIFHVTVAGHTDSSGSDTYNQTLSDRRSETIVIELKKVFSNLSVRKQGYGESQPVISNSSDISRALNRRVSLQAYVGYVKESIYNNTLCFTNEQSDNGDNIVANHSDLHSRVRASKTNVYKGKPPLSVGDRIRLLIPAGDEISGVYEIGTGGNVEIPFLGSIEAHGLTTEQLEKAIVEKLEHQQLFRIGSAYASATLQEWAPIDVLVSGATFDPGRVTINKQKVEFRNYKQTQLSGDFGRDRLMSAALFSAGGIRPDADLQNIQLIRNGEVKTVDLSGIFYGTVVADVPLTAGDQVVVPSSGRYNGELVRRTQITPPGIRIFISNLTIPATDNSKSAINGQSTSVPYGTRFLRGLISSNCVGGTQLTNAARRGVLVSTNPITGRTEVIERSIQQLVSDPDRDDINPHLMPNDGIACYDSGVTNFRDVSKTITEFLTPLLGFKKLAP